MFNVHVNTNTQNSIRNSHPYKSHVHRTCKQLYIQFIVRWISITIDWYLYQFNVNRHPSLKPIINYIISSPVEYFMCLHWNCAFIRPVIVYSVNHFGNSKIKWTQQFQITPNHMCVCHSIYKRAYTHTHNANMWVFVVYKFMCKQMHLECVCINFQVVWIISLNSKSIGWLYVTFALGKFIIMLCKNCEFCWPMDVKWLNQSSIPWFGICSTISI